MTRTPAACRWGFAALQAAEWARMAQVLARPLSSSLSRHCSWSSSVSSVSCRVVALAAVGGPKAAAQARRWDTQAQRRDILVHTQVVDTDTVALMAAARVSAVVALAEVAAAPTVVA